MEMVSKPRHVDFKVPNPGSFNTVFEKKENTGGQMGHTKKYFFLKQEITFNSIIDLKVVVQVTLW